MRYSNKSIALAPYVHNSLLAIFAPSNQRIELRPHDARMHPAVEWALGEAAIGAGEDVLAPDQFGEPHDAFGDQFRMFDHVGGVADDAGNEHFVFWQFCVFPHSPFVLVSRIGAFDDEGADIHVRG